MTNDEIEVDDLDENLNKKKKIKSGQKGKRGERLLVDALNERFKTWISAHPDGGGFSRSVGSGNRVGGTWGQGVMLSKTAQNTYSGDITCPDGFKFILESKIGYNDIDLCACFGGKCQGLDAFLNQVTHDSTNNKSGRRPMLLWKKDRKETIVFLLGDDFLKQPPHAPTVCLFYGNWRGFHLDYILSMPDQFFFN